MLSLQTPAVWVLALSYCDVDIKQSKVSSLYCMAIRSANSASLTEEVINAEGKQYKQQCRAERRRWADKQDGEKRNADMFFLMKTYSHCPWLWCFPFQSSVNSGRSSYIHSVTSQWWNWWMPEVDQLSNSETLKLYLEKQFPEFPLQSSQLHNRYLDMFGFCFFIFNLGNFWKPYGQKCIHSLDGRPDQWTKMSFEQKRWFVCSVKTLFWKVHTFFLGRRKTCGIKVKISHGTTWEEGKMKYSTTVFTSDDIMFEQRRRKFGPF